MTTSIHIKVNNEVLIWARNSLALSKHKAAESIGINSARLDKLENGEKSPTIVELRSMAKIYKRTIATLLLKEPPHEKPLPSDRRTINSANLGTFHAKTILAVRKARALANSLVDLRNETGTISPIFNYSARITDSPKEIAYKIRRDWNLDEYRNLEKDSEALEAYIEHIESLGIAVFQLSLNNDSVRGFSLTDESVPVVVIKRSKEYISAKIFTLFHELGHILLREGGICDFSFDKNSPSIEKWCNAFAAEILMPSDILLNLELVAKNISEHSNYNWKKNDLIEIGKVFHMGPLAILRRLLENGLTTSEFYESKHIAWNQPAFGISKENHGRNIPREIIKERGKNYVDLAFKAFDQNKIDLKDLSDYLGLRISLIPKTRQLLFAS
jgi:Zn-dependent peptidase ImmA (M78 family)